MLGNRDECRLVVRRRIDRRQAVETSWNTSSDVSSENAVLGCCVQPLEEGEPGRVCGRRAVEAGDLLDHDVRMSLDIARGRIDLLRRGEEVLVRVDEVARLEVPDRYLDREVGGRLDRRPIQREHKLGRGHVRHHGDGAHSVHMPTTVAARS